MSVETRLNSVYRNDDLIMSMETGTLYKLYEVPDGNVSFKSRTHPTTILPLTKVYIWIFGYLFGLVNGYLDPKFGIR